MRRQMLWSWVAVGTVASGVGLTGVIAPVQDRARIGVESPEEVRTGRFPDPVDIQIASMGDATTCTGADWSDELTSPLFQVDTGTEQTFEQWETLCVRNVGVGEVGLNLAVVDVVGEDLGCAPNERPGCDGTGELEVWLSVLNLGAPDDCPRAELFRWIGVGLQLPAVTMIGRLAPGAACPYRLTVTDGPAGDDSGVPYTAQTDALRWRFRVSTV